MLLTPPTNSNLGAYSGRSDFGDGILDLAKMGRAVGGYQVCVDAMRLLEVSERPHTVISGPLVDRAGPPIVHSLQDKR